MTITEDRAGSFGKLGRAIGLTSATGTNSAWFSDPMGGPSNPTGLKTILSNPDQRTALLDFVDEILGPPQGRTEGTTRWVPLFANHRPDITVYAVVETLTGSVRVGIGVDYRTGTTAPFLTSRLHVPLIHLPNGAVDSRPAAGGDPTWLLIGHRGGVISIELDARFTDGVPVPRETHLGGARVRIGIPTSSDDSLTLGLDLVDLQLPGAASPTTRHLDVDSLAEMGREVLEFIVGLVRAQVAALDLSDDTFRHIAGLTGILGLRDTPGLPPLPLADLLDQGPSVLARWIQQILGDDTAQDAWLGELARLVGGHPVSARNAVSVTVDGVSFLVGLRVTLGTGGHPVLVPWMEVAYATRTGVSVGAGLDVIRLDTATVAVDAVPQVRATAVFGADSAPVAARLLTGGPVQIGSVHVGVALDDRSRPGFALTLHDVTISAGGAPRHHDLLDLSSPDAALDALDSAIDGAVGSALDSLGAAGTLIKQLLGIEPPADVADISIVDLIADPLAALRRYYRALLDNTNAMAEVLGTLHALLTAGSPSPVPGVGTSVEPWRLTFSTAGGGDGLGLAVWRDGGRLRLAVAADLSTNVFSNLAVAGDLRVLLLDADLDGGHVTLASQASARVILRPRGHEPVTLSLGVAELEFRGVGMEVGWRAGAPSGVRIVGDGLALLIPDVTGRGPGGLQRAGTPIRVDLPMPSIEAGGGLSWTPDWDDIELALGRLLTAVRVPALDTLVDLLGWSPTLSLHRSGTAGARLSLAALMADPAHAIARWAADMALDCQHLEAALGVLATVLSGGSMRAPLGLGSQDRPHRTPIAGVPGAPGIVVWTDPPCPPVVPATGGAFDLLGGIDVPADGAIDDALPVGAHIAEALHRAAVGVPGLDDLLFARSSLGAGLDQLIVRWTGTDGITGPAASLPHDVTTLAMTGYSYTELAALGRSGLDLFDDLAAGTAAIVHLGCDAHWGAGYPDAEVIDATGGPSGTGAVTARVDATANGRWFVRVPTPQAAASARADHDGVAGQASQLLNALEARTSPIVVVGYGAAGAAALRAAASTPSISAVVTVGTPWSPASVTSLQSGTGGDALAFVRRLLPTATSDERWPDELLALQASPLVRGIDLVRRWVAITGRADLPSAGGETRRPGLEVKAVFGTLRAADAVAALAAVVAQAVADRSEAAFEVTMAGSSNRPDTLHVGIDVPALSAELGGLTIGAGVAVDLVHLARPSSPAALPTLEAAREITVTLDLAVTDGWLVGGPGAASRDLEVRWIEARVHVPLSVDSRPAATGFTELVLHEARAYTAYRDRWVIRADGETRLTGGPGAATTALPEVKILLGEVIARIRTAVPSLATVLEHLGLIRAGGLDPDGLDRLLFDPGATLRPLIAARPSTIAAAVNALTGAAADSLRPASAIDLGTTEGRLRIDLATGVITGSTTIALSGMPRLALALEASPAGAMASLHVGSIDPSTGGVALHLTTATAAVRSPAAAGLQAHLEHRPPADPGNAAATTTVALLPTTDVPGLTRFAATVLPAVLIQVVVSTARQMAGSEGRAALDAGLEALGLLSTAADNGTRTVVLPIGLLTDPAAWLARRADPLAAAVTVLEAIAPFVAPARGAAPGWPIDPAFGITYEVVADRLELVAHLHVADTLDGSAIAVDIGGGLSVSLGAPPQPVIDASVTVEGWGLRLGAHPGITIDLLRPPPNAALGLYPAGPGLGGALADVGVSLLPQALNALAGHRRDAGSSLVKDVGAAIYELGDAMGLMEGGTGARQFTTARINAFAQDPAAALLAQLPTLASAGLAALARALDPTGTLVRTSLQPGGVRRFVFGAAGGIHVDLDGSPGHPGIAIGGSFALRSGGATLGHVVLEHLRLTPHGVGVDVRVGPVRIDVGSMVLRPIIVVRVDVTGATFTRLLGLGLGLDDDGDRSVEFRWALDASRPVPTLITRTGAGESPNTDPATVAVQLVGVAVSLASSILATRLHSVVSDAAAERLQGVVFTGGGRTIDPGLITDLVEPDLLLRRLYQLAWNCATGPRPLSLTIDDTVTLALAASTDGADKQLGLSVSLARGRTYPIVPSGEVIVNLEVDASWVSPTVPAGFAIYVLRGPSAAALHIDFGVSVAGLGLRFTKSAGPLLQLGAIALDGLAIHLYGEASRSGVGGGVRLQLSGLAVAPAGNGSGNRMANSLVNDAGAAGANNRPSFSPSLSIQKHPGHDVAVGLRAGEPPGPWWVVIQRQLGPIYVERVGLDTVEQGGRVTRISMFFSGSVSLFGLSAALDRLSLNWNGGDILSIDSWSADLMGLAVSADMAGVSLAGGLLKSVDEHGVVSYVGMLVGRFATYGLSVFGGYSLDPQDHASFFLFGAVIGPIGGPPAFFLTGLGGGLGINRRLVIPTDVGQFPTYPFIVALDPAARPPANPMARLQELNSFFPHAPGNFWFAAGISFTCFSLVDGIAVVSVSFGDGLEINLLGLARMALPRPGAALVSIELALLARFSTREGVFIIKAQLTDNSWLLYEDIRLTGGFAFAVWWKGPLSGQFVLTMGGYHPDFHQDGYPEVPRLGMVWRISDAITMKGESYFALTSEAVMAGTAVDVSVDFGWVWARLSFGADGIIYFDPFFFDVRAYCRLSAGIKINLGLFEISLSITLGASVHVWGPDFAGEVVFEIGPCAVPIRFGPQAERPGRTIDWPTFVTKYLEDAGGGRARAISGITGRGTLPTSTNGQLGAPSADGSYDLPFQVFAEFEISFTTTVPAPSFVVGATRKDLPVVLSNGASSVMGLAPMGAGELTSQLVISLRRRHGQTWVDVPELAKLAANLVAAQPTSDGSRLGTDAFPTGVWGEPKAIGNPVEPPPSGDVLITGNRIILVAGVESKTQGPTINYYQVKAGRRALPLSSTGADRIVLLQTAATVSAVTPASAEEALRLAERTLFETAGSVERSALAKAAYTFDRVSPPRFGNLADGLATANGQAGARPVLPAPDTKEAPAVRTPFVAGYFASGVGAAGRAATTTVADGRIKRRPAPTTDSVRARLGAHVPAVLEQTPPPALVKEGRVLPSLSVPRTDVLGAVRTIATGPVGSVALNSIVGGIGRAAPLAAPRADGRSRSRRRAARADGVPDRIATGDVVALQLPDARIDASESRPSVTIKGRSRVVMVAAHGVVFDDDVIDAAVPVPIGTTLLGIQADGDADALDGYPGWHDRSRIGMLAARAAIGSGCTIIVDGRPCATPLGWCTAGALTLNADEVHTRFSRPVHTIAVALTGVAPRNLDQTQIHIVGGQLARDKDGRDQPPVVATIGRTSVLVYAVVPNPGANSLTVSITPGAEWAITAVLGAGGPNETPVTPATMAEQITRNGVAAVSARLTAPQGPGCRVDWMPAEPPKAGPPRTRPRAAKKSAATWRQR